MTKCPYVPPHPWNVDFPHLMLRAQGDQVPRRATSRLRDRLLTSTDRVGKLATIPVVVQAVNAANRTPAARKVMERRSACTATRGCRRTRRSASARDARRSLRVAGARRRAHARARSRSSRPATSTTTSPASATTSSSVLEHNEIPYALVEQEACCGMPKLELGDLETRRGAEGREHPACSRALARDGYAILTAGAVVHADVQAGAAAACFPDDADVAGGAPTRCSIRSSTSSRATRTACCKTDFKRAARQGQLSHSLPLARAEHRPEDARGAGVDCRTRRSTPSSAARATTAPGA